MNRLLVATSCAALVGAVVTGAYIGVVTGRLTFDLGLGRRTRPLGPFHLDIAAPRETVFAVAAAPYADRQPRAMREKVEILERAGQMVLAAHRTPVGSGLTAVTVETVTLDPPKRMGFRLLRGPVLSRDRDLHLRRDRRRDPAQLQRRARHRPLATRPGLG
jgi:hypothetical protein